MSGNIITGYDKQINGFWFTFFSLKILILDEDFPVDFFTFSRNLPITCVYTYMLALSQVCMGMPFFYIPVDKNAYLSYKISFKPFMIEFLLFVQ